MKKLLLAVIVSMAVISLPVFANAVDGEVVTGSDEKYVNPDAEHDRDWIILDTLGQITQDQEGDVNKGEPAGNIYRYQDKEYRQGVVPAGEDFDWGQTRTNFRAELSTTSDITNDDGVLKLRERHVVRIASDLTVDEDDVGKAAKCMVVAGYSNKVGDDGELKNFMLSKDGWVDWKGSLSELVGMECILGEDHSIIAHDDELFAGEYRLFFGYQLANGKIVHSPEALRFRVE